MFTVEHARSSIGNASRTFIPHEPRPAPAAAATARRGRGRPRKSAPCRGEGCGGEGLYGGWCHRHEHHHAYIPRFRSNLSTAWDRVWAPFWDHHKAQLEELAPRLKALGKRFDPDEQTVRVEVLAAHGLAEAALDEATHRHRAETRAWREALDERCLLRNQPHGDGSGEVAAGAQGGLLVPAEIRAAHDEDEETRERLAAGSAELQQVVEASAQRKRHPTFPWLRAPQHLAGAA